jgi:hypothetical protein
MNLSSGMYSNARARALPAALCGSLRLSAALCGSLRLSAALCGSPRLPGARKHGQRARQDGCPPTPQAHQKQKLTRKLQTEFPPISNRETEAHAKASGGEQKVSLQGLIKISLRRSRLECAPECQLLPDAWAFGARRKLALPLTLPSFATERFHDFTISRFRGRFCFRTNPNPPRPKLLQHQLTPKNSIRPHKLKPAPKKKPEIRTSRSRTAEFDALRCAAPRCPAQSSVDA